MLAESELVLDRLRELGRRVRDVVVRARERVEEEEWRDDLAAVSHQTSADTIYKLDLLIEPVIEEFCEEWGRTMPLVVVAEGIEPEAGRVFPAGAREEDARVRVIMDPVDGTRGLMYDKRAAWFLAGAAPNKGEVTRLSDIEVAVMTELPTSKMSAYDVLWAVRGRGAHGVRERADGRASPLRIAPSRADTIAHGFAMISNFFPGTKVLASELMEEIVRRLLGEADVGKAMVFDDQYISTGGQFYELIVGHDRFNADLRPLFYRAQGQPEGLCCHPYDCAALLVAREAGVMVTDGLGRELDGPFDVTTGLSWAGFANPAIRAAVEPMMVEFFGRRGIVGK
jgi:hypothetical protein